MEFCICLLEPQIFHSKIDEFDAVGDWWGSPGDALGSLGSPRVSLRDSPGGAGGSWESLDGPQEGP